MPDSATLAVALHGFSELALAFRMSSINVEMMGAMRKATKAGLSGAEASAKFLASPYYRNWSRSQLNNTEYAPMLALLCFALKYKADKEERSLSILENIGCWGSVISSYIFCYAVATQQPIDMAKIKPGQGGMSPLRPVGALTRYASMALLIFLIIRPKLKKDDK